MNFGLLYSVSSFFSLRILFKISIESLLLSFSLFSLASRTLSVNCPPTFSWFLGVSHTLPFLLTLPISFLDHLLREFKQVHLPFSNERRRLPSLLPRITLLLYLTVVHHFILNISRKVL